MQEQIIKNIHIVLVATTHPGNIGASARAMKTMGIEHLALVAPKIYPDAEVTARAAGADDILMSSTVHESLSDAVINSNLVLATSARDRSINWPVLSPQQAAAKIIDAARQGAKVALVFGPENSGLSNEELELCNAMIRIPANPHYSSLNLASAVQILCYELRKALLNEDEEKQQSGETVALANNEQMNMLYEHLQAFTTEIGFFDPEKPRLLMRRLKRLFNRAQLDVNEYNILRGIIAAAQAKTSKHGDQESVRE